MEQKNIGKTICKLRKIKGLTQEELGKILNVGAKTISKWECGYGMPDISILKKISEEFDITVDELLDGKIIEQDNVTIKYGKKLKIIIILFILFVISMFIILINNHGNEVFTENNCTVIRTYNVREIGNSNDENYLYVTLSEYQVEGVYTIKLPKTISNRLEINKSYVFVFKTDNKNIYSNADILFENSEIINVKFTDKVGMDSESRSYCD